MTDWVWPSGGMVPHKATGTLDQIITIKASSGVVEMHFEIRQEESGKVLCTTAISMAPESVADLIARLEAARDAASLMASVS